MLILLSCLIIILNITQQNCSDVLNHLKYYSSSYKLRFFIEKELPKLALVSQIKTNNINHLIK